MKTLIFVLLLVSMFYGQSSVSQTHASELQHVVLMYDRLELEFLNRVFLNNPTQPLPLRVDPSCMKVVVDNGSQEVFCVSNDKKTVHVGRLGSFVGTFQEYSLFHVRWNPKVRLHQVAHGQFSLQVQ